MKLEAFREAVARNWTDRVHYAGLRLFEEESRRKGRLTTQDVMELL